MYYYKDDKNLSSALGQVDLGQMLYVTMGNPKNHSNKRHVIELKTTDRDWVFVADSDHDMVLC